MSSHPWDEIRHKRDAPLRKTAQFRALESATNAAHHLVDHYPDQDPEELIPRFFESGEAINWLEYVREWDMPNDVSEAIETAIAWLRDEHRAHDKLLHNYGREDR